jgi:signal transduction histidine kinase
MTARLERHQRELVQSQKLASIGRLCAGVAHEINGPLGIILGYAKVIRKEGADDEALGAIEDEARQCQRIVQALLDMSRQEIPRFAPVDLVQLAQDGVDRLKATGKLAGREVVVKHATAPVIAFGDEAKLRQVVLNLLSNAAEATRESGRIHVEARVLRGRAVLSVSDDGPGMSPSTKEHLFEPFFTTKDEGTGLGLAISRAIVEAHRGEIWFEPAPRGGTRVEVRLESAPEPVAAFA